MQRLQISDEVREALDQGQPVVGLETAVVTHGLPFPTNVEIAQAMEQEIRDQGAVPATVAVLGGKLQVGVGREDILLLAQDRQVSKLSRRDISRAVLQKRNGGTTVAGTLAALKKVGIKVFATGGIGGVHRGAGLDVSADLPALGDSPVLVVCSGAKAILDLPGTLELLETLSVPVVGYQTEEFPAFYSRSSGLPVSVQVEDTDAAADLARAHWDLGLESAVLLVVPPPIKDALPEWQMKEAVNQALVEAENRSISGQAVTPFLLSRVSELTEKSSLKANIGLLLNNARVAAQAALSLSEA
jgi:pseudouridine-5'-phosphate glycosidase